MHRSVPTEELGSCIWRCSLESLVCLEISSIRSATIPPTLCCAVAAVRLSRSKVHFILRLIGCRTPLDLFDFDGKLTLSFSLQVTPSSKVVGDLANFMVANGLNEKTVVEKAEELSFPQSVVEFMQGYIGQPVGGFPEPFRSRVLKGKSVVNGRPGASIPASDLDSLEEQLKAKYGPSITDLDVMSAALYPQVFDDFQKMRNQFSDLTVLPTKAFLSPMAVDEEIVVSLEKGQDVFIKFKAVGELLPNGKREVFFELNGVPRVIEVRDRTGSKKDSMAQMQVRELADPDKLGSVGAPMSGTVLQVLAKAGSFVDAGEPLVVLSAMKMETTVSAPCSGTLQHVTVTKGDSISAGELLVLIDEGASVDVEEVKETARA